MRNARFETEKRILIANKEADRFKGIASGIILAGSVAYAPNYNVSEKSDVDLVVTTKILKKAIPLIIDSPQEKKALESRFFEGYCVKSEIEGVPVSIHVLSDDAFDIISKCFVADLRVYRSDKKPGVYNLFGFQENSYQYTIKNITLPDLSGVRTIVPVSFIHNDRYHLGIHRDKLLTEPVVLYQKDNVLTERIDKLWRVITENLVDESIRIHGKINLTKMNVLNALSRKNKMSPEVIESIKTKAAFYLEQFR